MKQGHMSKDCTAISNEDTLDVVIGLSELHKQVICLKITDSYLLECKVILFRQTFTLSYQIWTKCSSLCAPLQNSLPWFIHIAWGYEAAHTQYRLDADKKRRSATLTHSWACGGCSGPRGRSWSLVRWHCHSWSFGTEEGGPEEETFNLCHSQSASWAGWVLQCWVFLFGWITSLGTKCSGYK